MKDELVEKLCGCPPPRWPKCPHDAWYLKPMQFKGKTYEMNVTRWARVFLDKAITTKTEAEAAANIIRGLVHTSTYVSVKDYVPPPPPPKAVDYSRGLGDLAQAFTTDVIDANKQKRQNSKVNDKAILNALRGRFGDTHVMAAITIKDLGDFRTAIEHRVKANSSWAKYRTLLGQFWRWATRVKAIPVDIIRAADPDELLPIKRGKNAKRVRRISEEEWQNLLEAAKETRTAGAACRLWAVLVALMECNVRIGELLALQWRDVHLDSRMIWIRAEEVGGGKTGEGRPIPISDVLLPVLLAIQHDPAGQKLSRLKYVFGDVYGGRLKKIRKAFITAVLRSHNLEPTWTPQGDFSAESKAQLRDISLRLHDIRHEGACRMEESGVVSLTVIQQRLGHADVSQTATYLHTSSSSLLPAQDAYDAWRAARAGHKPGASQEKLRKKPRTAKAPARTARTLHLINSHKAKALA